MSEEKKTCKCKRMRWLIPVIAVVVVAAIAATFLLLRKTSEDQLYWNIDRIQYSKESRSPDANGVYRIRFAQGGQIKELTVADKKLVDAIDCRNAMYLEVDKEGRVTGLSDPANLTTVARKLYIKETVGNTVHANSSMALSGRDYDLQVTDQTLIYDAMPGTQSEGKQLQVSDLRFTDAIVAYANTEGQITHIFATARSGSSNVYWRIDRKWDNTVKQTDRTPDADGVYTIDFYCNGSVKTLKCKTKALVTSIDQASESSAAFSFTIDENDFITRVQDIRVGAHGVQVCPGYVVRSSDGKTFTAVSQESATVTFSATLPDECGIYDVSPAAYRNGRAGEATTTLQVGDKIYLWADADGVPMSVYVQRRQIDVPAFRIYPTTFYNSATKETARTPNAEGWYLIELIKAGETGVQVYRTQDKALVDFLDSQSTTKIVGLELDGDVITQVYSSSSVFGGSVVNRGMQVDQVVGCMINVQRSGSRAPAISMIMTENCKIYDISGMSPLGTETELRRGDVLECQSNLFGQIEAVYITRRQ